MRIYKFFLVPKGHVPLGEIAEVVDAGEKEIPGRFSVRKEGTQLVCSYTRHDPIQPSAPKDHYVEYFLQDTFIDAPLRLFYAMVKYADVTLQHGDPYRVQDPVAIFSRSHRGKTSDTPIYIICCPEKRTVTLSMQIIEEGSLAVCRQAFHDLQRGVEEQLVKSALGHDNLQRYLVVAEIEALFLRNI